MKKMAAVAAMAAAMTGCGLLAPTYGSVEVRVTVCARGTAICVEANQNVAVTVDGATMPVSATGRTLFPQVETGVRDVSAEVTGDTDGCWFDFHPTTVTVVEDRTASVTVGGEAACS